MYKLAVAIAFVIAKRTLSFSLPRTNMPWGKSKCRSDFKCDRGTDWDSTNAHRMSSSSTVELDSFNKEHKRNKFEFDVYNKPLVLIGCRGAGDELNKLASSYVNSISPYSTAEAILRDLEETDTGTSRRNDNGGLIITAGSNSRGTWVLTYSDIQQRLQSNTIDKSSVIVIDFDSPVFYVEDGKYAQKLTQHLTALAKALYENENMLVVYINVHPELSGMGRGGRERKFNLEENVFIRYSDYELCVKGAFVH